MALKSGFYPSSNRDRLYSAKDFANIFNNLISDGVLPYSGSNTTGDSPFRVRKSDTDPTAFIVSKGAAWFNSTWLVNDDNVPIEMNKVVAYTAPGTEKIGSVCSSSEERTDALAIEVNFEANIRNTRFVVLEGVKDEATYRPYKNVDDKRFCHLIATFKRPKGTTYEVDDALQLVGNKMYGAPFLTSLVSEASDISGIYDHWRMTFDALARDWTKAIEDAKADGHTITVMPSSVTYMMLTPSVRSALSRKSVITINPGEWEQKEIGEHVYYCRIINSSEIPGGTVSSTDIPEIYPIFDELSSTEAGTFSLDEYDKTETTKQMFAMITRAVLYPDSDKVVLYAEDKPDQSFKIGYRVLNCGFDTSETVLPNEGASS